MTKYIGFICGHNSGRSQMAQGAFNHLKRLYPSVDNAYEAISWGTGIKEGGGVNPKVIDPMKEVGIDLTDTTKHFPKTDQHKSLKDKLGDVVRAYTLGCMDNVCELPYGMQIKTEDIVDWDLDDPADDKTDVNAVRNQIIGNTLKLIVELDKGL